jgi:lipid II:glycine glycyltransferase (peptidoglycan interpeptide bridge formation enzyme)
MLSPYFYQTRRWADFWKEANGQGHDYHFISLKTNNLGVVEAFVYEYPWFLGQKFLYLPEGPILRQAYFEELTLQQIKNGLVEFSEELFKLAQKRGAVFLKVDLEAKLSNFLNLTNKYEAYKFWQNLSDYKSFRFKSRLARKRIMYTATMLLNVKNLHWPHNPDPKFSDKAISIVSSSTEKIDQLRLFFQQNQEFFKKVNQHTRYRTKKSLDQNWKIDTVLSNENFEAFWKIYDQTVHRQDFTTHPKEYFAKLYTQPETRIIILRDELDQPQAVWFGRMEANSLVYLYGGNTSYSMDKFGQYLIHLEALRMAKTEGKDWYDLGGLESGTGYTTFKERYKGQTIYFAGPVDLVVSDFRYDFTNFIVGLGKFLWFVYRSL